MNSWKNGLIFLLGALALLGMACGSNTKATTGNEAVTQPGLPAMVTTQIPAPVPTQVPPTPTPLPIPTTDEIKSVVNAALATITTGDSEAASIKTTMPHADSLPLITDSITLSQAITLYQNVGNWLIALACRYADNAIVAQAAWAIHDYEYGAMKTAEQKRFIESGTADKMTAMIFFVPTTCPNPAMKAR